MILLLRQISHIWYQYIFCVFEMGKHLVVYSHALPILPPRPRNVTKVNFSGAVNGKAVWPSKYKPVAWNDDADSIMFKLGIYHTKNKVGDVATNGT